MYRVIGMEEFQVKLASFQDVQELSRLAAEQDFPIRLSDGSRECSAKSFMCIFSLNLKQQMLLKLDCSPAQAEEFRRKLAAIL